MNEMMRSNREEETKRREEAQIHQLQQQVDELRRALRDNLARQQWIEELYKQNEGKLSQLQIAQDRYVQEITQSMHARQMEDARVKQQIGELAIKVEEPLKPLRELRAQVTELTDTRRTDRERTTVELRPIQEVQSQMRELVAQIGMIADAQRQLRDLVQELDGVNSETRQEIQRVAEMQRLEEQRLRRQGVELQEIVEALRLQFGDVAARSHRIDDLRKNFMEHIEGLTGSIAELQQEDTRVGTVVQRLEKTITENHISIEDRVENMRAGHEASMNEVRGATDQRLDRSYGRFQVIEDRLRELDQRLADLPPLFASLYRRDEDLEILLDQLEDTHLRQELSNVEGQIEQMRARRAKRQAEQSARKGGGLIKSVRDARPPSRPAAEEEAPEETNQ